MSLGDDLKKAADDAADAMKDAGEEAKEMGEKAIKIENLMEKEACWHIIFRVRGLCAF